MAIDVHPDTTWYYAAECAVKDGFTAGTHAWMKRVMELLPIVSED